MRADRHERGRLAPSAERDDLDPLAGLEELAVARDGDEAVRPWRRS